MNLTGTISDKKETLPSANIFVSDKNGKIIIPTNGSAGDINGSYTLMGLKPEDYVTVSFVGYAPITKKVSSLGLGPTITHNFIISQKSSNLPTFAVVAKKDEPIVSTLRKNKKNYLPYIIGGGIVIAAITGIIIYKSMKK